MEKQLEVIKTKDEEGNFHDLYVIGICSPYKGEWVVNKKRIETVNGLSVEVVIENSTYFVRETGMNLYSM